MDALSLLFCTSATERHAELKSWLYVALAAMAFVIVGAGAELIILEIAFALALCLRSSAATAAGGIRKTINEACTFSRNSLVESRRLELRTVDIDRMTTVVVRRSSLESLQACFASLGLPHLCLASRLLPQPVSIARQ
jgi:hypothetical protein